MPAPSPAAPSTDAGDQPTGFDAGHAHGILRGLVDAGAELVALLVKQASADPVPHPYWGDKAPVDHPTEHIARCYERITRSIRRTIVLAMRLHDPVRQPACHPGRAPVTQQSHDDDDAHERLEAGDVLEFLEGPESPERPDSPERLDTPDWDIDAESEDALFARDRARPLGDVIAEIRADLAIPLNLAALVGPPMPRLPPPSRPPPSRPREAKPDQPAHPTPSQTDPTHPDPPEQPPRPGPNITIFHRLGS